MKRSGFLFRARQIALLVLVLGTYSSLIWASFVWERWNRKEPIEPSGGWYFFRRTEIPGPLFRQADERWRNDLLGPTPGTLGGEGCAVSSAAMVLASYGIDTDPQRLNAFLKTNDGFTEQGWIYWEKAAELAPERVRKAYEDLPTSSHRREPFRRQSRDRAPPPTARHHAFCRYRRQGRLRLPHARSRRRREQGPVSAARIWQQD
jgi:Peptidase_C39 like family